jgi:hypothetical protein
VHLFCATDFHLRDWEKAIMASQDLFSKFSDGGAVSVPIFFSDSTYTFVPVTEATTAEEVSKFYTWSNF